MDTEVPLTKTRARYAQYMGPLLDALRLLGDSSNPTEARAKVVELLHIPETELEKRHVSGTVVVYNDIDWAKNTLKFHGLLDNSTRGIWSLTEQGRSTFLTNEQADELVIKESRLNALLRQKTRLEHEASSDGEIADDVELKEAPEGLLQVLQGLSASGFERLSQRLLREAGFSEVIVTGRSGDGGIDGHGILEINELVSFRVLFQCKRYQGVVGSPEIRNFRGAMSGRTDKGIIITTGTFTADAEKEATRDGVPPVELVNGERMVKMMERLELGVKRRHVFDVDYDFFESYR